MLILLLVSNLHLLAFLASYFPIGYLTWNARKKAKIQCAIRDDQAKRDIPYVTNRYRKLHSLRYYAPDTITYLLKVLQEPICAFDYAQDINTALNRTAICCPPK